MQILQYRLLPNSHTLHYLHLQDFISSSLIEMARIIESEWYRHTNQIDEDDIIYNFLINRFIINKVNYKALTLPNKSLLNKFRKAKASSIVFTLVSSIFIKRSPSYSPLFKSCHTWLVHLSLSKLKWKKFIHSVWINCIYNFVFSLKISALNLIIKMREAETKKLYNSITGCGKYENIFHIHF